jgi:hypothetical protein
VTNKCYCLTKVFIVVWLNQRFPSCQKFAFQTVKISLSKLSKFPFSNCQNFLSKLSKFPFPNCQNFPFQTVKISFSNCPNFLFQNCQNFPWDYFKATKFSFPNCQNFRNFWFSVSRLKKFEKHWKNHENKLKILHSWFSTLYVGFSNWFIR